MVVQGHTLCGAVTCDARNGSQLTLERAWTVDMQALRCGGGYRDNVDSTGQDGHIAGHHVR